MSWWVVESTLVAAVLAAVAALVPQLRPLGPAARHTLWLIVVIRLPLSNPQVSQRNRFLHRRGGRTDLACHSMWGMPLLYGA